MMKGYIHSIETMATADGPGIRTVVFMQGCPLRCRYCHNPDTWERLGSKDKGADDILNTNARVTQYTVEELFDKVIRYREYYGGEGGVTAGGGEPLLQAAFLTEFFRKLKTAGVNTALDTAGSVLNADVKELLKFTDLIILDIKHTDGNGYDELCGVHEGAGILNKVMSFLDYCISQKKRVWLRQVIIPDINDTKEQVLHFKRIAEKYNAEKAELLPYHTMGVQKWEKLGLEYSLKDAPPMDEKKLKKLRVLLSKKIKDI